MARLERTGLRWGVYARLSEDKRKGTDLEEIGVSAQIEEVTQRLIAVLDPEAHIVEYYVDNDLPASGRKTRRNARPDYRRMKADARRGHVQAVGAVDVDRYTRRPKEFEELVDIYDAHGTIFASLRGFIDLTTPAGRLFARNLANFSAYEGEQKVERQKLANAALARAGKRHKGGMRCYGYSEDGTLVPEEVDVIREAARRVLAGEALRALVRDLTDRGVKSSTGKTFSPTTLKRLLINPRLTGRRTYLGEVVAEDVFPRILSDEEHERLVAKLDRPPQEVYDQRRSYLLSGGLAICGRCGAALQSQRSNSRRRGYACRQRIPAEQACSGVRIAADPLEDHVAAEVLARYASPRVRQRILALAGPGAQGGAAGQIAELEERLAELGRERARGEIDKIAFQAAQDEIRRQLRTLRGRVRHEEQARGLPPDLPTTPQELAQWWRSEEATLERKRALITAVLDHVSIGPGIMKGNRNYEPERVNFVWK